MQPGGGVVDVAENQRPRGGAGVVGIDLGRAVGASLEPSISTSAVMVGLNRLPSLTARVSFSNSDSPSPRPWTAASRSSWS